MAFVYAYFFSDFLCFDMSLLLLTVTLRGVSNKHCLLSFFFILAKLVIIKNTLVNCQFYCIKRGSDLQSHVSMMFRIRA